LVQQFFTRIQQHKELCESEGFKLFLTSEFSFVAPQITIKKSLQKPSFFSFLDQTHIKEVDFYYETADKETLLFENVASAMGRINEKMLKNHGDIAQTEALVSTKVFESTAFGFQKTYLYLIRVKSSNYTKHSKF
jgi:hypothetical protein